MKPQLGTDEVNVAVFIPNAWMRCRKLPSSNWFHRSLASSSLLVYSAWNISSLSAGVSVMLPASARCRMSVIMASFMVDAAG